ncbi:MAG TPA: DUF4382 domain-containing protein [Oscillatoriaceae cyanobacterium M33_DOE_052]|uniref:DUF4382 domain-containing protein n=1 Tax=Planktothricoides sp. SpSt-374 TaxID=2282167 RepID=A0A7C3ZW93_9CYAN|nr:DUF4382 domain-containing protein [Oscillatoriaceae cyanobacterium M33_DOE_052]
MKQQLRLTAILVCLNLALFGCAQGTQGNQGTRGLSPSLPVSPSPQGGEGTGTLEIRANGEDFVREGFVSKDGWQISFDRVDAHISSVSAYQTDPPYDAEAGGEIKAKQTVSLPGATTVDLALGDEKAPPVVVGEVKAPPGTYNAIAWKLAKATTGENAGSALMLQGKATKDGKTLDFQIKIEEELAFSCGEFVGDDRKGILTPGGKADLELTFHFDHLFGDGSYPPNDDINLGAIGFEPLAALASGDKVEVDLATLKQKLSAADYQKIEEILPSLGHVGEGHCHAG